MKNKLLYYVYCALGEKSHECDSTSDKVAFIRLLITLQILVTNLFIIGGVIVNVASIIHHWENEVPSNLHPKQKAPISNILPN